MRILSLLIVGLLLALPRPLPAGTFTNLGPQITASTLIGTTFTKDTAGRDLVCSVMRGQPAKLVVFDLATGDIVKLLPLPGAEGGWNATTATDGSVYVGTDSNGHVYRWTPGADAVQDLGQIPDQTWVWDLCPGKDGEIFCSTYPGCRIVRYHPRDGFKEISNGPASPNEQYARTVAYDPATRHVYAGVGSHAHLVDIDPATGSKTEFLPPEYAKNEFVYGLSVYGDHLLACVVNANKSIVFNLRTKQVETVLPQMTGQQVMTKSPTSDTVYYTVAGHLYSYDLAKSSEAPTDLLPCPDALGMSWSGDSTLIIFTRNATVVRYDLKTHESTTKIFEKPIEPVVIQSMTAGPDGRIWMGGYLSGGNAAYDPATGKSQEYKSLSQAESIAVLGHSLYFGLYPGGHFATYDTAKDWQKNNPKPLGKIEGQSRPFAGLGVPELNQVFFGTVPEYGLLGGGIAVYSPTTAKLDFYHNVVQDHSVISLAYSNGLLVGGTSIFGGLGTPPSEKNGKLFLWDPKTHEKIFETIPVDNAPAVSALIVGPDKNIWGVAGSTLFLFDPTTRQIRSRHPLDPTNAPPPPDKHLWRDATLLIHPSGQLYGTQGGRFFRLDPQTKAVTVLREKGVSLLAMDAAGRLYFRETVNLWQYTP